MNLFKKFFNFSTKTKIIFIVEDNLIYAKTLEAFLKTRFTDIKEIKIFPIGEVCLLELHLNPSIVIIDYFLDTKYPDAITGLETIKQIKAEKPDTNIIVLSGQKEVDVIYDAVKTYGCSYVKKDEQSFHKLEHIIQEIW
jgi:DNA-binding NarL/FixJ family response regulator